jgi:hypothetical protein
MTVPRIASRNCAATASCRELVFSLVKCADDVCALMLEVIRDHHYGQSRFVRGATIAAWGVK